MTQCLAVASEHEWHMGVAAPDAKPYPKVEDLHAFRIPPKTIVKLDRGTWHAGPLLKDQAFLDFYNLELSDTNVVDHTSHSYVEEGITIKIVDDTS